MEGEERGRTRKSPSPRMRAPPCLPHPRAPVSTLDCEACDAQGRGGVGGATCLLSPTMGAFRPSEQWIRSWCVRPCVAECQGQNERPRAEENREQSAGRTKRSDLQRGARWEGGGGASLARAELEGGEVGGADGGRARAREDAPAGDGLAPLDGELDLALVSLHEALHQRHVPATCPRLRRDLGDT